MLSTIDGLAKSIHSPMSITYYLMQCVQPSLYVIWCTTRIFMDLKQYKCMSCANYMWFHVDGFILKLVYI